MRTALLFPGQGSQASGMRELASSVCPDLVELALAEVGEDPFDRVDDGTRFAQPAIYCASIALWSQAGRPGAAFVAGHSLGELAALVAGGSISAEDGVRLAARRGRVMQEAAELMPDGGMLALLGDEQRSRAIGLRNSLFVANDNAPGQLVFSGPAEALETAAAAGKVAGIKAIRLAVKGAFHTPAMELAVPELRAALAEIEVRPPRIPVLSSITTRPFDDVRTRLADALVRPVRWRETLLEVDRLGVERYVETGPGKVLKGLVRRTLPHAEATTLAELTPTAGSEVARV